MLANVHKKIKRGYTQYQQSVNFYYAFFLVFVTPLSIPFAIMSLWQGSVTPAHLWVALVMYCISGLGISVGYHRFLAHRAFQASHIVKFILLVMGALAMQGGPASWASIHIQHHVNADKAKDPHSPIVNSFWYAHCGWLFHDYNPDFTRYGKRLVKDPIVMHVTKYYFYYSLLGLIVPAILGGWLGFIWGGLLRLCICCNMTWCVNSVCHIWGQRDHKGIRDFSRNNFWVSLFTFGEGWHNNHHKFLQMPFFGQKWYQIDMGKWLIVVLEKCHLICNLKIKKVLS